MIEKIALSVASILILYVGIYVCLRHADVAEKIKLFYMNYPIIKYAGSRQLTSSSHIVRFFGVVLVLLGIICLFSIA